MWCSQQRSWVIGRATRCGHCLGFTRDTLWEGEELKCVIKSFIEEVEGVRWQTCFPSSEILAYPARRGDANADSEQDFFFFLFPFLRRMLSIDFGATSVQMGYSQSSEEGTIQSSSGQGSGPPLEAGLQRIHGALSKGAPSRKCFVPAEGAGVRRDW